MIGICVLCKKNKRVIRHHQSYDPELVVLLCNLCHNFLHYSKILTKEQYIKALEWIDQYVQNWGNGKEWHGTKIGRAAIYVARTEERRLSDKRYNATHKEERKKYNKKYYAEHAEKEKICSKNYYHAHKERAKYARI